MGAWQTCGSVNDGYPLHTDNPSLLPQALVAPFSFGIMRTDGETNDGYPFLFWMEAPLDPGLNQLLLGARQPSALYYGALAVQACYCNGQPVYRPA